MESLDLYKELELSRSCSQEEIKQSYKKLALKWHPDKNKGNEEMATLKFQRISEAYSILSDAEKKEHYDKYGTINEEDFDFEDFMNHFNFQDLFGSLFGDLNFAFNFADLGRNKPRGRAKNKYSKAQMRREQKEAEKLFKEFSKLDFAGEEPGPKKEKKQAEQNGKSEDEWDTEEEYTDDDDEGEQKKGGNKGKKEEEDDDDYENVDSEEEEQGKRGFDPFGGLGLGKEDIFLFPIFMDENTVEAGKKYKCKFDNKVFKNDDELFDHFDGMHKKEFKNWAKNKK